jgi:mannose-6-phosphate isomerase-like protein (cupin superfamily)
MPRIDNSQVQTFTNIPGVQFTPVASPSRGSSETAVWRATVLPGGNGTVHHMTREEIIVAVNGEGVVTIGPEAHTMRPGDAFAVPAFVDFKLDCSGDTPFEAMVVLPVGGRAVVAGQPAFQPPWSV